MDGAAELVQALWAALAHVRHYGSGHPSAGVAIRRCADLFRKAAPVQIVVEPRRLVVQGQPFGPGDPAAASLRAYLEARRVPGLVIGIQAAEASVAALIRVLAREPEEIVAAGGLRDALGEEGADGIDLPEQTSPPPSHDAYDAALDAAAAAAEAAERGEPVDLPRVRDAAAALVRAMRDSPPAVWIRVADRAHDETDPAHAVNVAVLTAGAGAALGLTPAALTELAAAAFLHDIGLAILPYPRRLAERTAQGPSPEWTHPAAGAWLLRHAARTSPVLVVVASEHHLPSLGDEASAPARLVSLADYVDALTCGRVPAHRKAAVGPLLSQVLAGGGPAFDPSYVRALARALREAEGSGARFSPPERP
ncbi:MAG: HD domain-containing protein [Armatimonadota bacterium]|nr:HD domain-containing protein [Armatimonadota bacterium]MDR7436591.1 HD domain-containing protein [Armatimonadota bacterium]MDR7506602.1 HD domain-containing protein [Armatimonadota bacterium]MDR7509162.1 HD domain-containing protein [Armatimonadota bacterium]MDR7582684.1 HD domain-containing protein [Armatimonadota bacterium]